MGSGNSILGSGNSILGWKNPLRFAGDDSISAGNVTADYFIGNGAFLTVAFY